MNRRVIFLILVVIVVGVFVYLSRHRGRGPALAPTPTPLPASPSAASATPFPSGIPATTAPGAAQQSARQAAMELLQKADALQHSGQKEQAWKAYSKALLGLNETESAPVKKTLAQLSDEILFSRQQSTFSTTYTVKPGDTLSAIGDQHKIPYQLIMKVNGLKSDLIHPGDRLKLISGPFNILVDTGSLTLTVYLHNQFVKEYPVGLGEEGLLPEGQYAVRSKLINPAWTHPQHPMAADDPLNPLGERWIGFYEEYGIHGTIEPETIGKRVSLGCVRMHEKDVEEVFDLVVSRNSQVEVRDGLGQ